MYSFAKRARAVCASFILSSLPLFPESSLAAEPTPEPAPAPTATPDPDLEALRKAAEDQAGPTSPQAPATDGTSGLSRLNPEISAVIDGVGVLVPDPPHVTDGARSGFIFRELELSFAASVDHLARFKAFVGIGAEGAEIEEATILWPGLLGPFNLTVGRMRQSLDPVNRWHTHALDQADLPRVHRIFLGDEGLAQTGLRLDAVVGVPAFTLLIQIEVTNSENEALFAGEFFSLPSFLAHVDGHLALGASGYLELGGGALVGFNHQTGPRADVAPDSAGDPASPGTPGTIVRQPTRTTSLFWGDFAAAYDPAGGKDRFGFFVHGGVFYRHREMEDALGNPSTDGRFGGYAYVHARLDRSWHVGLRGDWVEAGDGQKAEVDLVPVVTFWQSEYLFLRAQYQLGLPSGEDPTHVVMLQLDAGIGPHYHERY